VGAIASVPTKVLPGPHLDGRIPAVSVIRTPPMAMVSHCDGGNAPPVLSRTVEFCWKGCSGRPLRCACASFHECPEERTRRVSMLSASMAGALVFSLKSEGGIVPSTPVDQHRAVAGCGAPETGGDLSEEGVAGDDSKKLLLRS